MRRIFRVQTAVMSGAGLIAAAILYAPPAWAKKRTPTPTPIPTATPTPAPIVKEWNFDQDKAHEVARGWTAAEGEWRVLPDPTAPSPPNGFGLGPGRLIKSLTSGLEYSPYAVVTDPTEYSDFTLEASFKATKGWFDCSGGLIFRYSDPKNYYLLQAGCPSDYFALYLMLGGKPEVLKQTVVPIDQGVWYDLKVVADGDHLACYSNNKMVFDVVDSKIKRGRIGLWAHDDSQALFDNLKLTLAPAASGGAGSEAPAGEPPAAPAGSGGGAPPPLPP